MLITTSLRAFSLDSPSPTLFFSPSLLGTITHESLREHGPIEAFFSTNLSSLDGFGKMKNVNGNNFVIIVVTISM
jgi:hypothetical protein